ncbi:hypothetical protein GCM10010129_83500 [Streptomyces fumigatiscleroticus]|nr:hypothetical protein GCM10010129_83500 [Streptomyces fumigatiscleroticus]
MEVTSASGLDIDHLVPLTEAWDSGTYANDQGATASLVTVTARSRVRLQRSSEGGSWLSDTPP